jgi:hypothetical protein
MFANREQAARQLAERLQSYAGTHPLVLAIPRGGVPMGKIVADALGGELDVVLVHKLGAPGNPELAIGAVSEHGTVFIHEQAQAVGAQEDYVRREAETQRQILQRRRKTYTPGREAISPEGRTVIVVDDGGATGATMTAALHTVRQEQPRHLVAAMGVAPPKTVEALRAEADAVVCLETPRGFTAVGQAFVEFGEVTDAAVIEALRD